MEAVSAALAKLEVLLSSLPLQSPKLAITLACLVLASLVVYVLYLKGHGRAPVSKIQDLEEYLEEEGEKRDLPADIDAYDHIKDLKTGGFSRVKMVRRTSTGDIYAMKLMNIHRIFDEGQVRHTLNEKEILANISHPFIVNLYTTFKDDNYLYYVLELVRGGELFDILKEHKKLEVDVARFYAANVIVMIEYLHKRDIAFRDLKSENLLLDDRGYLKLIDFGMARYVKDDERCNTFAGTLDYVAPEILSRDPYKLDVDWWALGCLIYEMLTGVTPFKGSEEDRLESMLAHSIDFEILEDGFDPLAKDLIEKLLYPKYTKRLGTSHNAGPMVRGHPWFNDFDWIGLVKKQLSAPALGQRKDKNEGNSVKSGLSPIKIVPRSLQKVKSMRQAVENDPPESPRTYSPKAIDMFFTNF